MVSARFAVSGLNDINIFSSNTVSAVWYRDDILIQYVLPFLATMGFDYVFMGIMSDYRVCTAS